METKATKKEHELLQNFADTLGLTVHVYEHEDKRRNNKFCVYKEGKSVSGKMDYNECNHFFLGWLASKKQINKNKQNENIKRG